MANAYAKAYDQVCKKLLKFFFFLIITLILCYIQIDQCHGKLTVLKVLLSTSLVVI